MRLPMCELHLVIEGLGFDVPTSDVDGVDAVEKFFYSGDREQLVERCVVTLRPEVQLLCAI